MILFALIVSCLSVGPAACRLDPRASLPEALSDEQFRKLITDLSEPAGAFEHSENLVSNETQFAHLARVLRSTGGVYIGVGPEQNFSYIARLRPAISFIIDIRQENRNLHLMYKALFELSADRADFMSRLFSRERPVAVPGSSVDDLFTMFDAVKADDRLFQTNARLIRERLEAHRLGLSEQDLAWIDHAFRAFYSDGPAIQYGRSRQSDPPGPSYRVLMTSKDRAGQRRSYLGTDEAFAHLKDLHSKNLIVPVVGDFAGPHAIRRVADYIRQHHERVRAFYGSNVEVYLTRQRQAAFCANLATLPHDARTWFIGSKRLQSLSSKLRSCMPAPSR